MMFKLPIFTFFCLIAVIYSQRDDQPTMYVAQNQQACALKLAYRGFNFTKLQEAGPFTAKDPKNPQSSYTISLCDPIPDKCGRFNYTNHFAIENYAGNQTNICTPLSTRFLSFNYSFLTKIIS